MPTRRTRTSVTRHGVPLVGRIPAIKVGQRHKVTVEVVVRDDEGNPQDLTEYGLSEESISVAEYASLQVAIVESVGKCTIATLDAWVTDAANGVVQFDLDATHTRDAGVFMGEILIQNDEDTVAGYQFYLHVDPTPGSGDMTGPPTEAEIRLHMRDSMPDENYLIDELDFDLAEIGAAIGRPVMYWNESLPPIGTYDTTNFPYRYHWLEGIVANLCFMAAEHYRRNTQNRAAGGIVVNDLGREQPYLLEGQRRWEEYKKWVANKKVSINIQMGYSTFGSPYGY
jgi:hypothetical protein